MIDMFSLIYPVQSLDGNRSVSRIVVLLGEGEFREGGIFSFCGKVTFFVEVDNLSPRDNSVSLVWANVLVHIYSFIKHASYQSLVDRFPDTSRNGVYGISERFLYITVR